MKRKQQQTNNSKQDFFMEESNAEELLDDRKETVADGLSPSDLTAETDMPAEFDKSGEANTDEIDYGYFDAIDASLTADASTTNDDGMADLNQISEIDDSADLSGIGVTNDHSADFNGIDMADHDSPDFSRIDGEHMGTEQQKTEKVNAKKDYAEKKEKVPKKPRSPLMKAVRITIAAAIIIVCGTMLYYHLYYSNRWYKNTYVNDVDVSGLTLEDSKKIVLSKMKGYGLTVNGRDGGKLTISGDEIDYKFKINQKFDELFNEVHQTSHLFSKKNELSVNYDVEYDEDKLNKLIKKSDLVKGSDDYKIKRPKSASVKYSTDKLQFICVEERMGNTIIKAKLTEGIKDALSKAETTLDINDTAENPSEHVLKDVYKAPRVTSDSPELQERLKASNSKALRFVSWNMGKGVTEQITPTEISSWISYKDGKIKYDWDAVSKWVEDFCQKYKTVGKDRKVKMHNGKTVTVKGGDYGWQLDFEKTLKQAKKALQTDISQKKIDAYIDDPSEENKAALTSKRKVQYANTAYRKDFDDSGIDWDSKNYIEISLSKQKIYVIRDGKVKFSCRTISGRPTPDRATKKGAYFIKEHRPAKVLKGADYSTPVKNWVRITWTGTGFHSATWQPWSRWTKDFYKTRGSHGCLNLSMEDSQQIYKLTKYREAVFIY